MNRSDKFRQANREALATVIATIAVIIFWCLAGFGLADSNITSLGLGRLRRHLAFCHRRYHFPDEEGFCQL